MSSRINLLVTGGCGFIASNFINHIAKTNKYNIINVDAMYYCANEENVDEYIRNSDYYTFVKGNVCSEDLITHILPSHKIEQVIHLPLNHTFKTHLKIPSNSQEIIY